MQLYVLDAQLSSHLHAGLRLVEITLREHLHRALAAEFGDRWFELQRDVFDEQTREQLDEAIGKVDAKAPAGKVVAQLMVGTWVNLLGRGGHKPDGDKAQYVRDLWTPAFQSHFDYGTRKEIHGLAHGLNFARNRINHCEPVVFGFPQPGMGVAGIQVRRAPALILADMRDLLGCVNPLLQSWAQHWADVDELLNHELLEPALNTVDQDPRVDLRR
ncbi:hypothetical protein DZF95_00365 [Clavibacter michiganensis]|nr:hypothetical protein DZF95_00365 [Clavibacter michiganensis]